MAQIMEVRTGHASRYQGGSPHRRRKLPPRKGVPDGVVNISASASLAVKVSRCSTRQRLRRADQSASYVTQTGCTAAVAHRIQCAQAPPGLGMRTPLQVADDCKKGIA
jgi:hypothetical protein